MSWIQKEVLLLEIAGKKTYLKSNSSHVHKLKEYLGFMKAPKEGKIQNAKYYCWRNIFFLREIPINQLARN